MSYSSLMTNIWPPPNDEVRSRLERLQELKQLREKRGVNTSTTSTASDEGGQASEGSRLSRRQMLSTRTLPTLRRQEERRLRSTAEKTTKSDQHEALGDRLTRSDYGGARPKNLAASLRQNLSQSSEILTLIKKNEPQGPERHRTTSADSDTFDDHHPSENVINRSTSARLTSIGSLGSLADELETDIKAANVSVESENTDHVEDIESFKQSLYGNVSETANSVTKGISQDRVLAPFTDITGIIKSTGLSNRVGSDKSESRSLVGDSSRWRKNVHSAEKTTKIPEVSEKSLSNGITDEGENVNSNSVAAEKQGDQSESIVSVNRIFEDSDRTTFERENIVTGSTGSNSESLSASDIQSNSVIVETSSEVLDGNSVLDNSSDIVIRGSFNTSDLASDYSVRSQADMSDYRDSILNESDSIFDYSYGGAPEEDTFCDSQDSWQRDWSLVGDGSRRRESSGLYNKDRSWQTNRSTFERSGGYAPKPSRREVLTAPNRPKPSTRIVRYTSLPSSADTRVSDIRSRYLNKDTVDSYSGLYQNEDGFTSSYRETKQEDISSRLGNILSDSFKKFDSVIDGGETQRRTEEPSRSLRRSYSQKGDSIGETRIGRYRKTSETNSESNYRSGVDTGIDSIGEPRIGRYRKTSETNSESNYRSGVDTGISATQPNLDMHEFIANIRSRTSGDSVKSSRIKPLARTSGVSSVIENAKKMLLGIQDEPETSDQDEQFLQLRQQTEFLTESLEEAGKSDNEEVCESEGQSEEDIIDNTTAAVLERGGIITLTSVPPEADNEGEEMEGESIQSVEVDEDTVLVNKAVKSDSGPVTAEPGVIEKEGSPLSNETETVDNNSSNNQSDSKTTDSKPKQQTTNKGKNKKKKKGKKKKETENKSPSSVEKGSQSSRSVETDPAEQTVTSEIADSCLQKDGSGSVGKQFDSMIEDIDHQSEKTSVATEDLLSLIGKGEGNDSLASKTESGGSNIQCNNSKNSSNEATSSKMSEENFATFEEEDPLAVVMKQKNGHGNHLPTDNELLETASEEEFYEAMPGEFVDEEGNVFVEHREEFIYVTSGSKVRKRKLSKKSLLGEKHKEQPQADVDSSRLGHVKEWMESNIFPSNNTLNVKDLGVKTSDQGSSFSVASTIGDFDSRGSLDSKEKSEDAKTVKNESVLSSGTSKSSIVATEKRSTSVQTKDASVRDNFTQMLVKARNIGVQIDVDVFDKFVQTISELMCPCCKNTFNIQDALNNATQDGLQKCENDRNVQKVKEELKLKLHTPNKDDEDKTKIVKSKSSSGASSKSSSSRNSMATPPKSPSLVSSTKRSPHGTPQEKSPSVTPRKQSPSPIKRNYSAEVTSKKSPATTPRKQSPTRKSPATTPRKQSPSRKSPATTPRKQSPARKSPASTPRKQSPAREGTTMKSKKLSPSNSTDQSSEDGHKENSKVRKERVSSVQNLLYHNGEQTTMKKPEIAKKPTTQKVKREKSSDREKREASAERRSDDGSSEKSNLPGYMQPTKSSRRKKSIGSKDDLLEDGKQKKGTPTTPRKTVAEKEDQETFTTMSDNPFIRSDRQRASVGSNGQKPSGKWYRKEPLKTEEDVKKGKVKSPKKQRSISTSSTSSEKNLFNGNSVVNSEKMYKSHEKLDLSELGSQSSLLETDLDEAMGCKSDRSETSQSSETVHEYVETIAYQSSVPLGPDLKSYAENVSRNIAEMEVMKLNSDSNQNEKTTSIQLSLPPGAETKEAELEVTQTPDSKGESTVQNKLLSDEEQAGVPLETEQGQDEVVPVRVNLSSWDPTKLLQDLYAIKLQPDNAKDISDKFVAMQGLMEKLPMNKKKATLLKTWKRRFFKAEDGWLYYYETSNHDKPSDTLQLMGGKVDDLGNRILGIDDGRGKYLMVRCPTDKEYGQWKLALESQTADNVKATYVRPVLSCPAHQQRKVILIDIGSSAIRAGILGEHPTLPSLFFPNMVARSGQDNDLVVGIESYKPEYRKGLAKTVRPMDKVDKFSIDMSTIGAVFKKIFTELKVEPADYWLMISTPQSLADKIRADLMGELIDTYRVQGVCMVMQSLLALYSYNATSGIIVDIGERMEILPIYDGFVIEGGVSRQSYGGQKVLESLNSCLHGYKFSTPIQQLIVRYVMEQSCYLVTDYKDTLKKCEQDPENYRATVYLNNFDLPQGSTMEVTHDYSCFKSPEGFFNTDLWGMDYPCVHKLVFQAIQSCPIDSRKRMYRAIYLSGGVTMLPGFADRLQCELQKLAPPSVMVEVHASPQRYHSAYIGACSLASMEQFQQICISAEEWKKDGVKTFRKWNMTG
ncbi:uncharacterized protein [Magallana gigas]|uniref:uncharacterized protein isoform X2 n=1 Tax=Magallana gigas TaxID=29159 RepID=UPI00334021E4